MDTVVSSPKSVRKQKSLQKLFSLPKRKGPRSRAPSVEHQDATPPPAIPDQFLPSTPTSRGPSVTSSETFLSSQTKRSGESLGNGYYESRELCSPAERMTGEPLENRLDGSANSRSGMQIPSSPTQDHTNSVQDKGHPRPLTPSFTSILLTEKPKLPHKSPTDLILPKRAQRGLQTPVPLAISRDRGASTSSHRPQPKLRKISIPSRPSTAAGLGPERTQDDSHSEFPSISSAPLADSPSNNPPPPVPQDHQIPWQALYNQDEIRTSFRSALTTSSIYQEAGSTERTSVLTRGSSLSDVTIDHIQRPPSQAGSMTVDDAIGMYAAGFTDDIDTRSLNSKVSSRRDEVRRSLKLAEAMNDSIGSELLLPPQFPAFGLRDSTDIMSGDLFSTTSLSQQPPPIMPPTTTRDQYGFRKKSHQITAEQYESWYMDYEIAQDRRTRKWIAFLRDQGLSVDNPVCFPTRGAKVQRYIRKGIPPAWRGSAWFFYAGGDIHLLKHQGLYDSLLARSQTSELNETEKETIERDLHRTFPDNIHFKSDDTLPDLSESPLLSSLRHVLYAFALHHPRIGYCQSLNFLAGLLLLFLPEEKAFWMLHIITASYLPGTHEISLEGANVDLWVLMLALKETLPAIFARISGGSDPSSTSPRLPPVSLCATSWFMSLFIGNLPIESVLRVWDVLFYEGSRTIFRVALAIFKIGEREIRNVSDSMEIFQVVQSLPRGLLDAGELVGLATRRGVGQAWVEKKRAERREWYRRERVKKVGGGEVGDEKMRDGALRTRGRADSGWRRRVGLGR
ncbi:hypothetical protein MMC20_007828 [Loxospora ochrophaea]|nr:hypothetical protein [Loxospora ochrophaea]